MKHCLDWRKTIGLLAVLALLCGMGLAAVAELEQRPEISIDSLLYPWSDPGNDSVEISFNQVEGAGWYSVLVQDVTDDNWEVWNEGYIAADDPTANVYVRYDEANGVITYAVPLWYEDDAPVFEPGERYRFWVSACNDSGESLDSDAEVLMLNSPMDNVTMTVADAGANQDATVSSNSQYRVRIACEGATIFQYYDGDRWSDVHHRDNLSEEENAEVDDEEGTVVFNWNCGDSCETVLTCRVMSEGDEEWTQGPVITLTVEGDPMPEDSFALYHLYAGDEPLEPDENDVYHITRGTPLVVRFDENEDEQDGQWYGMHLIDAGGEWRDYHHWDWEDRSVVYPTEEIEGGVYQVRVAAAAPGFDSHEEYERLEVSDAEPGQVYLSMDMEETDTCQNNIFRVYAPGAYGIELFMQENNERICDFVGESGVCDRNRGNSGVYHVYAVAYYDEGEPISSEVLKWTVHAWNGALAMQSIDAPAILAPNTDLIFTVGEIEHAQNWGIRVYDTDGGNGVWENGYDHCPGEINVSRLTEDENGDSVPRFEDGHTYGIAVYADAYGYEASYRVVCFMVAQESQTIQIEMRDDETGEPVDPQTGLLADHGYKVHVSGSGRVDSVDFYDGGEWYSGIFSSDEGEGWSFDAPEYRPWCSQGGSYNLLVKVFNYQDDTIDYAGLPVKVQSNGTLNKPNVFFWEGEGEEQYDVPTTTVTRGDALRVHVDPVYREEGVELVNEHYEVRIYGSHDDFADNYWEHTYFEAYGPGDFELPTAELLPVWKDEIDPEAEPVPMAYRVEVNAGADGWDNNWNYAEFTVVEPEQEERGPILTVMREDDVWVNEDTVVTAYAPGATNVQIGFEGNGELQGGSSEEYWTGTMFGSNKGWVTLTATAWYDDEPEEKRVEKRVWINSLGCIDAPKVRFDSATLPEGTDALTFSFDYGSYDSLDQCYQEWDGFAIDDQYKWDVMARLPDGEWLDDVSFTSEWMPRGEGDSYGPITLGADEGFQWIEGAVYTVDVSVNGHRCEGNYESATILCANEGDGAVTLDIQADSGRGLSELLRNENVQLHVTVDAPEDVEIQSVELFNGQFWDYVWDAADYRDFTADLCVNAGSYALMARVWYDGEDEPHLSNPVQIRVQTLGTLEAPEVTVQSEDATVARGEFLDVNIDDVPNADWDGYYVSTERWDDNDWSRVSDMDDYGLSSGPYQLPTGSLEPGRYRMLAWASAVGWNDSNGGWAEFTVAEPGQSDEDGFIISVSNDHPRTCENWKVSALYVGDNEEVNKICLVREDGCEPNDGRQYTSEDSAWALWSDTHKGEVVVYAVAGYETWNNEYEYQYTELFRSAPVTVTVEAEDGDLMPPEIQGLTDVLNIDDPDTDALTMRVRVDEAIDNFGLNIFRVTGGGCVYSQGWPAGEEDRDEEGFVYVSVPLDQIGGLMDMNDGQSAAFDVQVYTCAWNRNDAEARGCFVAARGGVQQSLEIALAEGEDADDLWVSKDFRLTVSDPQAHIVRVRYDCDNENENNYPTSEGSAAEFTLRLGSGVHAVWAEALYMVEDGDDLYGVWRPSSPLILNIQTMGNLDAPEVYVGDPVSRGEFMTVNVGEVYLDEEREQLAEGCELVVCRANEDDTEGEFMFSMNDAAWGENLVPTAMLKADERYTIKATAHNERYDDNWSAPVIFTVLESDEAVLIVSNDHPQTCERWTANAYIPGAGWGIELWAEDENGFRYDSFEQNNRDDGVQASFSVDNAVTLTLFAKACIDEEDVYAEPVTVTVEAEHGELHIALVDVPVDVRLMNAGEEGRSNELEPFEVKVDVSQTVFDEFTVHIRCDDGQTVYYSDPISVDTADDNGIVTVPVHVNTYDREDYNGRELNAGIVLWVEVYARAPGYDAGRHTMPSLILSEDMDDDITLALADGEDPDDLWASVDFRLVVNAPEALNLHISDDFYSSIDLIKGETETNWRMGSGTHLVWAEAYFPDEDYDPEENPDACHNVKSIPLRLNIQTLGNLDVPEVYVGDPVSRGEFMTVNVGEVYLDEEREQLAEGCELVVCRANEDDTEGEFMFSMNDAAWGENLVPTAMLKADERYTIKATAHNERYDDNWSAPVIFTVLESDEAVLIVSNDHPQTCERWTANAYIPGAGWGIELWAEDENGCRYDNFEQNNSEDGIQGSFCMNHAGNYLVYARGWVDDEDVYAGPVTVTVEAEHGELSIALVDAPTGVRLTNVTDEGWSEELEPFEVKVDVSQTASDEFTVFVRCNDGQTVYYSDPISVDTADDNGIVTVPVRVNTNDREDYYGRVLSAGDILRVEAYACAPGYNDAGDSLPLRILHADTDESVTLTLADGEDPDDLWACTEFRVSVNAPDALWMDVYADDYSNNNRCSEGETEIGWTLGSGTHLMWVDAYYPDEDYDPEENPNAYRCIESMPLRLNIQTMGLLDVPSVATDDSVRRGQFLNVNIGEVTIGEDNEPVDGYDLQVWQVYESENGERDDNYCFSLQAVAGDNTVPTAVLEPGDYYVKATAHKAGWDDNWTEEQTDENSFAVTEPKDGLVLTVSNDRPDTGELWWVSAVYKGSSYGIHIWAVDENGNDEPYEEYTWGSETFEGGESAQAAWLMNHSAVLTIHASVNTSDGIPEEKTVTVTVKPSTNSTLEIDLDGTPDILSLAEGGPQNLEIPVATSGDVESFRLEIIQVYGYEDYSDNNTVFSRDYRVEDFPPQDYPNGIRVYVPASTFRAEKLYEIHLYTARAGWNDCYRTARLLATAMTPIRSEDDDQLVLTVLDEEIVTGQPTMAYAWYLGDIGEERFVEVDVSGDVDYIDDYGNAGVFFGREWMANHAGEATVSACVRSYYNVENVSANVSTTVRVTANDDLSIGLDGMPAVVNPAQPLEIPVTVDENVERFNLSISRNGMTVFEQDDIEVVDPVDDVMVFRPMLEEGTLTLNSVYSVTVYTKKAGWNSASATASFIASDKAAAQEGEITLTVDPEDEEDRLINRPIWICYGAEGADQIRLMRDGCEVASAYGAGPEYFNYSSSWACSEVYWVEAYYRNADAWKVSEPTTVNVISRGSIESPVLTLSTGTVEKGQSLTVTVGAVENAEQYSVTIYEMMNGRVVTTTGSYTIDEPAVPQELPTSNLEAGKTYGIMPSASADGYTAIGKPEAQWATFTVTEPQADGAYAFTCSAEEVLINSGFTVSLYVKGAQQVIISEYAAQGQATMNNWTSGQGDGVVFNNRVYRRVLEIGKAYTLYGWYTTDGTTWEKLRDKNGNDVTVAFTVTALGELTVPELINPPEQINYSDTLIVEVAECANANSYRVELIDSSNQIVAMASSDRAGKLYFPNPYPDNQVGGVYRYRVSVSGKGYAEKSAIVPNITLRVLGEGQTPLGEPVFTNWPAVRKGETIALKLKDPDPNAQNYAAELIGPTGVTVANFEVDEYKNILAHTSNLASGIYSIVLRSSAEGFVSAESQGTVRVVDPEATLTLPGALKQIGEEAFAGVSAEIVVIPDGATSIGKNAFANCQNLGIAVIPDTVTTIDPTAFSGCENFLIECSEDSEAAKFAKDNGITYDIPAGE